jgi:hypothetical protein
MSFRSIQRKRKSELAAAMGRRSQSVQAEIRMANPPHDAPPLRGTMIGVLQWTDNSGQVRRWIVRQGTRTNNWMFCSPCQSFSPPRGMDWFFRRLRSHLSLYKFAPL